MENIRITIRPENEKKINDYICEVEGKATVRTICYRWISDICDEYERSIAIPKSALVGTKLHVNIHGRRFPRAYQGVPMSTQFDAVRTSKGWTLTGVYRRICKAKQIQAELSDSAKQSLIKKWENQ